MSTPPLPPSSSSRSDSTGGTTVGSVSTAGLTVSYRDAYEVIGDARSALNLLKENQSTADSSKNSSPSTSKTRGRSSRNSSGDNSSSTYTPGEEYNRVLLSALTNTELDPPTSASGEGANDFSQQLVRARKALLAQQQASNTDSNDQNLSSKNNLQRRQEWTMIYNEALAYLSAGKYMMCDALVLPQLRPFLDPFRKYVMENDMEGFKKSLELELELAKIGCRLGFVLLESMLLSNPIQTASTSEAKLLLDWISANVDRKDVGGNDPQLKFLLSLFKSRMDFYERDGKGKMVETNLRSARKELKTAMEIFQHKLLRANNNNNETGSLASSSSAGGGGSDALSAGAATRGSGTKSPSPVVQSHQGSQQQQNFVQPSMSRILQSQNQAALNLKANTEQLKGNVKKSLILCSEALGSVSYEKDDEATKLYYDAIHQNNLGLIYEASGKSYLALHSLSKAISSATAAGSIYALPEDRNSDSLAGGSQDSNKIAQTHGTTTLPVAADNDGTVRPDIILQILNNASICAMKTGNYKAAYECGAKYLQHSFHGKKRPHNWIRLTEACIGMHMGQKKLKETTESSFSTSKCSTVPIDGKPGGVLLDTLTSTDSTNAYPSGPFMLDNLPAIGSQADINLVEEYPLARAWSCIVQALAIFEETSLPERDVVAQQSARCSMAYVCMELKEYAKALKCCEALILACYELLGMTKDPVKEGEKKVNSRSEPLDDTQLTLIKRLMATARLYAAEASSILHDPVSSLTFILGDKKDNAIDRLAMDLSGVTIDMANSSPKAKAQLAKAQNIVRCNGSAAWSVLGEHSVSRQMAMSAQAMENSYSPQRKESAARNALLYGMLREGNNQGAALLTLLRSSR